MTGLLGTALILTGYIMLALRRDASYAFAVASLVWFIHGYRMQDGWLMTANGIAVTLATIAIVRGQLAARRGAVEVGEGSRSGAGLA